MTKEFLYITSQSPVNNSFLPDLNFVNFNIINQNEVGKILSDISNGKVLQPVIIIIDVSSEGKSGEDIVSRLRTLLRFQHIPIICLIENEKSAKIAELYRIGVNSCVKRKVEPAEFKLQLEEILKYWTNQNVTWTAESSSRDESDNRPRILIINKDHHESLQLAEQLSNENSNYKFLIIPPDETIELTIRTFKPDLILSDQKNLSPIKKENLKTPLIYLYNGEMPDFSDLKLPMEQTEAVHINNFEKLRVAVALGLQRKQAGNEISNVQDEIRDTEQKVHTLMDNLNIGVFQTDLDERIQFINASFLKLTGMTPDELKNMRVLDLFEKLKCSQWPGFPFLLALNHPTVDLPVYIDNNKIWIEIGVSAIHVLDGSIKGYIGIVKDISGRKTAEEALTLSEERYNILARGATDGLWDWDLKSGEVNYSERWKEILGYPSHGIEGKIEEWTMRIHQDDLEQFNIDLNAHLEGTHPFFDNEHRLLHKDGYYIWVHVRGLLYRNLSGKPTRIAGSISDITDKKVAEDQLLHDAFYDSLTGLPNRALLSDRLRQAITRAGENAESPFALLYIDLDRFLVVNESLGHRAGDKLLVNVSKHLQELIKPTFTLARQNADEFLILADGIDTVEILALAEKINQKLEEPFNIFGNEIFISASIGITYFNSDYTKGDDLIRDAEIAMFKAKTTGKGNHVVFHSSMRIKGSSDSRLKKESDLHKAIENSEFELYYQPIVSLSNNQISGAEALIRWNHPERGLLAPYEFIPLAEETGMILKMGDWVLNQAIKQLNEWKLEVAKIPVVSVNISARQFHEANFAYEIDKLILNSGIHSGLLKLEITESLAMNDLDFSAAVMNQITELGVRIAIDDFGTGYSSLSYLKKFPIHTLKIDQSFTKELAEGSDDAAIVKAIIAMAHSLKLDVVAEGVESYDKRDFLRYNECDHIQGYYYSRPLKAESFLTLLKKDREFN